jgi:hypothetical protein
MAAHTMLGQVMRMLKTSTPFKPVPGKLRADLGYALRRKAKGAGLGMVPSGIRTPNLLVCVTVR